MNWDRDSWNRPISSVLHTSLNCSASDATCNIPTVVKCNRQNNPIWSILTKDDHVCLKTLEATMTQRAEITKRSKRDYWQQHIDAWHKSGQSQQQYCHAQGIALATFGYWRRKLKIAADDKPQFYPLMVSSQTIPSQKSHMKSSPLRVLVGEKRFIVEIDEHLSPAILQEVIATLERL